MTRPKREWPDGLAARAAAVDDARHLSEFRCSTGEWYEDEVEDYVNEELIKLIKSGAAMYRLLLVFDDDRLVACAGHHLEPVMIASGELIELIRLHMLAIGIEDQGRRFDDGSRLSDAVLRMAIADALGSREHGAFTAIVANDNHRSMAVLERSGRWSQVRYGPRHIRLTGRLAIVDSPPVK